MPKTFCQNGNKLGSSWLDYRHDLKWIHLAYHCCTFSLLIDATDNWTRKALKLMDKADKWIRKLTEHSFDWVEKKNLQIPAGIIMLIVFGILSQFEVIPKLIS